MKKTIFILLVLNLVACSEVNKKFNNRDLPSERSVKQDSTLINCITRKDTIIDVNTSIKYIIIDSFYTVKVQLHGTDTLLDFKFNCTTPRGLIPALHSYTSDIVCLLRGSGQHYREFIILNYNSGTILIKKYEIALATNLSKNIVAYRNYENLKQVIIEDIKTTKRRSYTLENKYINKEILEANFVGNKLYIHFSNGHMIFNF